MRDSHLDQQETSNRSQHAAQDDTHTQGRCTMGATGCSYLPTRSALARPAQQPQTSRIERPRSSVQSASSSLLLAQQSPWAEATM